MRTTIAIDDDLIATASACAGLTKKSELVHAAPRALVEREADRSLARLGGSEPELDFIPPTRGS